MLPRMGEKIQQEVCLAGLLRNWLQVGPWESSTTPRHLLACTRGKRH
jgi:hypothetical protein